MESPFNGRGVSVTRNALSAAGQVFPLREIINVRVITVQKTRTGPESPPPAPADVAPEKQPVVASQLDHVNDVPDEPAGRSPEESDGELPAAVPATLESLPAAAIPQQSPVSLPASVTSLDNLHDIAPIAEALLKTPSGKARTGRLDELKALELLQQAVLLWDGGDVPRPVLQ